MRWGHVITLSRRGQLGFEQWSYWLSNRIFGTLIGHAPLTDRVWYNPVEFRRCRKALK